MGGLNSKHLFFTVLESGKSQIKVQADLVSGEEPLPGLQMAVFSYPHMTGSRDSGSKLSPVSPYWALLPFMRPPPSCPITSQRPHLLKPSRWGSGFYTQMSMKTDRRFVSSNASEMYLITKTFLSLFVFRVFHGIGFLKSTL